MYRLNLSNHGISKQATGSDFTMLYSRWPCKISVQYTCTLWNIKCNRLLWCAWLHQTRVTYSSVSVLPFCMSVQENPLHNYTPRGLQVPQLTHRLKHIPVTPLTFSACVSSPPLCTLTLDSQIMGITSTTTGTRTDSISQWLPLTFSARVSNPPFCTLTLDPKNIGTTSTTV